MHGCVHFIISLLGNVELPVQVPWDDCYLFCCSHFVSLRHTACQNAYQIARIQRRVAKRCTFTYFVFTVTWHNWTFHTVIFKALLLHDVIIEFYSLKKWKQYTCWGQFETDCWAGKVPLNLFYLTSIYVLTFHCSIVFHSVWDCRVVSIAGCVIKSWQKHFCFLVSILKYR